jgi:hypothetical protein
LCASWATRHTSRLRDSRFLTCGAQSALTHGTVALAEQCTTMSSGRAHQIDQQPQPLELLPQERQPQVLLFDLDRAPFQAPAVSGARSPSSQRLLCAPQQHPASPGPLRGPVVVYGVGFRARGDTGERRRSPESVLGTIPTSPAISTVQICDRCRVLVSITCVGDGRAQQTIGWRR